MFCYRNYYTEKSMQIYYLVSSKYVLLGFMLGFMFMYFIYVTMVTASYTYTVILRSVCVYNQCIVMYRIIFIVILLYIYT